MTSLFLRLLAPFAERIAGPALRSLNDQIHRLLLVVVLSAAGVGCLIAGLVYYAAALWQALMPHLGAADADLIVGTLYAVIAILLIVGGLRLHR